MTASESLRSARKMFRNAALGREELRHSMFVTETLDVRKSAGPVTDEDAGHGCHPGLPYKVHYGAGKWWHCRILGVEDRGESVAPFWNLARAAGKAARTLPMARELLEEPLGIETDNEDLWTILLYKLAWQDVEESPLRSFSYMLAEDGRYSIDSRRALEVPLGLQSELALDPFSASVYAIDLLLSRRDQEPEAGAPETLEEAAAYMVTKRMLAKFLGVAGEMWFVTDLRRDMPTPVWNAPTCDPWYRVGELVAAIENASKKSFRERELTDWFRGHLKAPQMEPPWAQKATIRPASR